MPTPYFLMAMFLGFTRRTALIFLFGGEIKVECFFFEPTNAFRLYWSFFFLPLWNLKIIGTQKGLRACTKQHF